MTRSVMTYDLHHVISRTSKFLIREAPRSTRSVTKRFRESRAGQSQENGLVPAGGPIAASLSKVPRRSSAPIGALHKNSHNRVGLTDKGEGLGWRGDPERIRTADLHLDRVAC